MVEDCCSWSAQWAGHPWNSCNAVLGVARLKGVERSGRVGLSDTLGNPWPPLAIRPCLPSSLFIRNVFLESRSPAFINFIFHILRRKKLHEKSIDAKHMPFRSYLKLKKKYNKWNDFSRAWWLDDRSWLQPKSFLIKMFFIKKFCICLILTFCSQMVRNQLTPL